MKFSDLEWKRTPNNLGRGATLWFSNDYGVSVSRGTNTVGGPQGLYEVMVLLKSEREPGNFEVVEVDGKKMVRGHLTEDQVVGISSDIENMRKGEL